MRSTLRRTVSTAVRTASSIGRVVLVTDPCIAHTDLVASCAATWAVIRYLGMISKSLSNSGLHECAFANSVVERATTGFCFARSPTTGIFVSRFETCRDFRSSVPCG